jgi:hypothetical protein
VNQSALWIVQAASETERLEARVGVECDDTEFVIVHPLHDLTRGGIDYQAWTANLIGDNPINRPAFHQVRRHVLATRVHEASDDRADAIQLRDRAQPILIEKGVRVRLIPWLVPMEIKRLTGRRHRSAARSAEC